MVKKILKKMKFKKDRLTPYKYWTKPELKKKLIDHVNNINPKPAFKTHWIALIHEAFESNKWDIIKQYNGCTIVQDVLHPCPACFCHDFMWISGHGGKISDEIFKQLMLAEGMKKCKVNRRFLGVRVGWFLWFKYKRKNVEPTKNMMQFYKYLKEFKYIK